MTWMSLIIIASLGQAAPPPPSPAPTASPDFTALAANAFTFAPQTLATVAIAMPQDPSPSPASAPESSTGGDAVADSQPSDSSLALNAATDNPFFQKGSWRWQITGAAATEFDDHFAFAGVGVSYFMEDNFTIDFELNGLYFIQDEDDGDNQAHDTAGINLAMQLRWHFLVDDAKKWSIYLDTGFGVLFTGDNVPAGGETFNFTPQAGIGFSMLLDEGSDARLLAGVKWHHTSNANLFEDNPGSNKIMVYAGFNFPF